MTWYEILLAVIGGSGGTLGFISAWRADRIKKELESHKSKLESKTYVSKVRFDTEFEILKELCDDIQVVKECARAACLYAETARILSGDRTKEVRNELENSIEKLKATLYKNRAFIDESIGDKIVKMHAIGKKMHDVFMLFDVTQGFDSQLEYERDVRKCRDLSNKITIEQERLFRDIRSYLNTFEVLH